MTKIAATGKVSKMSRTNKSDKCCTTGCRAEYALTYLGKKLCQRCWEEVSAMKEVSEE